MSEYVTKGAMIIALLTASAALSGCDLVGNLVKAAGARDVIGEMKDASESPSPPKAANPDPIPEPEPVCDNYVNRAIIYDCHGNPIGEIG